MKPVPANEKEIRWVFVVSILFKGLNALLEIILGGLFLFTGAVSNIITALTRGELIEDPNDFVATHIQSLIPYIYAHGQLFAAAYFLIHGIVKIVLVWALLKNKLWAYPTSLAVLSVFLAYQIVRYIETQSIILALLSIFDVFVLWLIWREYQYTKKTA
jgi:uncharacterized membrane protein